MGVAQRHLDIRVAEEFAHSVQIESVDQIAHRFIRADVCDGRIRLIPDQLVLGTGQPAERVVDASTRVSSMTERSGRARVSISSPITPGFPAA